MDKDSYKGEITDRVQDTETYIQLRTNTLAKMQKNVNAFIFKLHKENKVTTGYA